MKHSVLFSLLSLMMMFISTNTWADTYTHEFTESDVKKDTVGTIVVTLSDVEWTIAMDGGKASVFDAVKGAHFGTNSAVCNSVSLTTSGITGTITSITVEASRGTSLKGTMSVAVGGESFNLGDGTTTALTTDNTAYEFTGKAEGEVAIVWTKSSEGGTANKGAFYVKKITIEYTTSGIAVAKPVISPAGGTFAEAQTVTITAEEGCDIFYTLDETDPTAESTKYEAPFTVGENCTVKAIAVDADDNVSGITSAEFKFLAAISDMGRLCASATETDQRVLVEFNNWVVSGVKGSNVYFTDGAHGILLYQSGHGFQLGDQLSGRAIVTLTTYNECAEIKGLASTTEGVNVTKGGSATPLSVAIADLQKNMQGALLKYEGITFSGGKFVDDDDNTITPYGTFITLPELFEGKTYNITGVAIWFAKDQIWEIAPRSVDEIELLTNKETPVSSWSAESETVDVSETPKAVFTTNSDGAVTYESSNTEVATVDESGVITPVGRGITTITAFVAESDTYLPDSKSFTLTVTQEGYTDAIFAYNDSDIAGQGAPDTGAELTATRNDVLTLYANKAYAQEGGTHIKFYGSKTEKSGEEGNEVVTITEPSYISLSVAEGYVVTDIVLTATGNDYIKTWKDQDDNDLAVDGLTATWKGEQQEVKLTNQATSQARIKTIAVTYFMQDDPNSISSVEVSLSPDGTVYTLAGQRIAHLQKGINVLNGKKILVK